GKHSVVQPPEAESQGQQIEKSVVPGQQNKYLQKHEQRHCRVPKKPRTEEKERSKEFDDKGSDRHAVQQPTGSEVGVVGERGRQGLRKEVEAERVEVTPVGVVRRGLEH